MTATECEVMEGKCTSVLLSLACMYLAFTFICPFPCPSNNWLFPINKLTLYTLDKESFPNTHGNIFKLDELVTQFVLTKILSENDLTH